MLKLIKSRFPVKACPICGKPIAAGDSVWFNPDAPKGRKTWHEAHGSKPEGQQQAEKKTEQKATAATANATATREGWRFDHLAQYDNLRAAGVAFDGNYDVSNWATNGLTRDQIADRMKFGDLSQVEAARQMLDRFAAAIELDRSQWEMQAAGCLPCVPAYLAGSPESMWAIEHRADESAPLRMVVNTTISAAVNHEQILRRGIALLALAMRLAEMRPLTLQVLVAGGNYGHGKDAAQGVLVDISTAPLDLADACFMLTSTAYTRAACYQAIRRHGFSGSWPWNLGPSGTTEKSAECARMREALQLGADDLYIAPAHIHDPLIDNPERFVNEQLDRFAIRND